MAELFNLHVYGCQMNQHEAGIVRRILGDAGYEETEDLSKADLLLMVTCAVRSHAEQRALGRLSSLRAIARRRPGVLVGVLGCMSQSLRAVLVSEHSADLVIGPDCYRQLPEVVSRVRTGGQAQVVLEQNGECYDGLFPDNQHPVCGSVTIMRGCDNHCSYCIVPHVRGRERSKLVGQVLAEVEHLTQQGVKDITLLGQNVLAYRDANVGFAELLSVVSRSPGVVRLRFLTSHPRSLDEPLLRMMAASSVVCPALHLPAQSGSDRILGLMNRGYTRDEYIRKVDSARRLVPGLRLSTDLMVGFPSETDSDFRDTMDLVSSVRFDQAYMYRYSVRPGTKAEGMTPKVAEAVGGRRLAALIERQTRITREASRSTISRTLELLIESPEPRGDGWLGRTTDNRTVIVRSTDTDIRPGELVVCRVTEISGWTPVAVPLERASFVS